MSEMVEGGASLAWRLLATLEGGSLLLATSALLAYTARKKVAKMKRARRTVKTVLLTNTSNLLGKELKTKLESRGCVVHTIPDDLSEANSTVSETSGVTSEASEMTSEASRLLSEDNFRVDALVVVGAFSPPKLTGLQGMAKLVSEDVYNNLKLLQSLSSMLRPGGCVAWACAGAPAGHTSASWDGAADAFDTVLQANLHHVAKISRCEPVWVGRCATADLAAEKLTDALLTINVIESSRFSIRNAVHKAGEYIGRWLKIVT